MLRQSHTEPSPVFCSKAVAYFPNLTRKRTPHVHHIVPVSRFSNRSPVISAKMDEMHELLERADINVATDPMNLMVISAETHATLHTNVYITHVHSYIMSTDRTQQGIYGALFQLRLEIAAWDIVAVGF